MSMNNVFHPTARKWISPLYNIGEMTEKLRKREDDFMGPVKNLPDCEPARAAKRETERKEVEGKVAEVKQRLFGPKVRGKKKPKRKKGEDEMDDDEDDEVDDHEDSDSTESEYDGDDRYSDEDSEAEYKPKRKLKLEDDWYLFDSEGDDISDGELEDLELDLAIENAADIPDAPNEEPSQSKAKSDTVADEIPVPSDNVAPEVPLPPDTSEQDAKEFKLYFDYVERHAEKMAERSMERKKEEMVLLLQAEGEISSTEEAEQEFERLSEDTSPQLAFSPSEVIVEDPLIKGSVMPILAGPIPKEVLKASGTLAVYAGLCDEPGNFQWRMGHVVDILSSQLKGNLRLLREENIESSEDKKRAFDPNEAIVTVSIYQAVEEVDDILLEMRTIPEPEFAFEVEILSSQTVGDLCEMFACQADLVYTEPFKNPDDLPATNNAAMRLYGDKLSKNVYPWKAIFIQDTVYVNFDITDDLSEGKAVGLKRVKDWAARHRLDHGIREIKFSSKMDTKLSELDVHLGYPYVYIHQSTNCEHLWCFTSVRLPRRVEHSTFPRNKRIGKFPTKYCVIDNEVLARWAVFDCPRLPQNPMFLCTECVKQYCFTRKTRKSIGDFKLFPFFQLIHTIS